MTTILEIEDIERQIARLKQQKDAYWEVIKGHHCEGWKRKKMKEYIDRIALLKKRLGDLENGSN